MSEPFDHELEDYTPPPRPWLFEGEPVVRCRDRGHAEAVALLRELIAWRARDESYVSDAAFYAEEDAWDRARALVDHHDPGRADAGGAAR